MTQEELIKAFCEPIAEMFSKMEDKKVLASMLVYMTIAIAHDITFREACEKYYLKAVGDVPHYEEMTKVTPYIVYETFFELVHRRTGEMNQEAYQKFAKKTIEYLNKQLKDL